VLKGKEMHTIAAAAASGSSVSFGEIIVLIALIMILAGTVLGKKIENTFLSILIQLLLTLGAGVLIAAAYPQKILVPLYHISGGKLGIP
jgi:Flp pilus assembly pilin Flp